MFGGIISSILSDKFGRKPVVLISHLAVVVVGVANAFAPNYNSFIVLRFVIGMLLPVRVALKTFFCPHRVYWIGRKRAAYLRSGPMSN